MSNQLKLGMIGLDTSHVTAFTELLNDSNHEHYIAEGKVTVAFPGNPSEDFELSYSRVAGFTKELKEKHGIRIVDSCEAVAEACDAILLESVDGRVHLEQFRKIAPYQKPVFIDKPFTVNSDEAKQMAKLAEKYEVPIMSCSALRFAEALSETINCQENGQIIGADFYGPMAIEPTQPGFFWYGIHAVDMLYRTLGQGCKYVNVSKSAEHDLAVGEWADGRIGTIRGNRSGNNNFGGMVHFENGSSYVCTKSQKKPYYASLMEQIFEMLRSGKPNIAIEETIEIIRFIEAANESRESGERVLL